MYYKKFHLILRLFEQLQIFIYTQHVCFIIVYTQQFEILILYIYTICILYLSSI